MKLKKYIILLLTLFISFSFSYRVEALITVDEYINMSESQQSNYINGLSDKEKEEFQAKVEKYLANEQTKENQANNSSSSNQNEAMTIQKFSLLTEIEQNAYLSSLSEDAREAFEMKYEKYLAREETKNNQANNSSSGNGSGSSGSWCTEFNNVWYVFGIAIQIIYVVTPLLLIVTGSITMLQAMTKHDPGAVNKAQKALVNKIIAAVVVFLMISIVKMVTALVADDGWVSCANCAFNPNQDNCKFDPVETGQ